jgi:hypothetical protein
VGSDSLLPADLDRFVVNLLAEPFKLSRGMDSFAFAHVGILVHDCDDVAALGSYHGAGCDKRDVDELVVVDTLDVNKLP